MIDTNVIVDLLQANGSFRPWSLDRVVDARRAGRTSVSAIVVGELANRTIPYDALCAAIAGFGVLIDELGAAAAYRAGQAQKAYRAAGGTREMLLGDFLIGAHAATASAKLLTRDPRRYRRYLPDLTLITPETDHG